MDLQTLHAIYDTRREVDAANLAANVANASMADLAQIVHRQQAQLRDLSVAVAVLSQMLIEKGMVDATGLVNAIDQGIAEQKQASQQVRCTSCGKQVPMARTDIRMTGLVCDDCVAKGV